MNEKFYNLPLEKQQKIINAGFLVFAGNSYKKAPVREIAEAAGISKSLLFFYFRNKKDLYLFLWEKAAEITMHYLQECHCYDPGDLFDCMERGMKAKFKMMAQYPYVSQFAIKAFFEKDESVRPDIHQSYDKWFRMKTTNVFSAMNPEDFIPGLDLKMMYQDMYWAAEGYLWENLQRGSLDSVKMEQDFQQLLSFWKSIYLRKEQCHERN